MRSWLRTINVLCQKEKKSYNSTVLTTEMLIGQQELNNTYLRGFINPQGIHKHKHF